MSETGSWKTIMVSAGTAAVTGAVAGVISYYSTKVASESALEAAGTAATATIASAERASQAGILQSCLNLQFLAAPDNMKTKVRNPDFDEQAALDQVTLLLGPKVEARWEYYENNLLQDAAKGSDYGSNSLSGRGILTLSTSDEIAAHANAGSPSKKHLPAVPYGVEDIKKLELDHEYYRAGSTLSKHKPWILSDPAQGLNQERIRFCRQTLYKAHTSLIDATETNGEKASSISAK